MAPPVTLVEPLRSHTPAADHRRAVRGAWNHERDVPALCDSACRQAVGSEGSAADRRPQTVAEHVCNARGAHTHLSYRRAHRLQSVLARRSLVALITLAAFAAASGTTCAGCVQSVPVPSGGRGEGGFVGVFPDSHRILPRLNLQHIRATSIQLPRVELPSLQLPQISPQGLCNLLAGGVAGAVASAITCPLEVVKTQLQSRSQALSGMGPLGVAKKIVSEQGVRGLYRGLSPTIVGIIPTRSLYFWAYGAAKAELEPVMGDKPVTHMAAAVAAGGLSSSVTCPLWVTKTRMQLEGTSFAATVRSLWKTQGVGGFYRGLLPSYWGLSEGAIQFLLYEKLKRAMAPPPPPPTAADPAPRAPELSTGQYLVAAGLSKAVASGLTYPHEVVRTRMREAASARYQGFFQSIRLIAREEGTRGLYGGLGPHLMRVVPNTAIMFVSFELLSRRLPSILEEKPWERALAQLEELAAGAVLDPPVVAGKALLLARGARQALARPFPWQPPNPNPAPAPLC